MDVELESNYSQHLNTDTQNPDNTLNWTLFGSGNQMYVRISNG
jgi:hypothetical protein